MGDRIEKSKEQIIKEATDAIAAAKRVLRTPGLSPAQLRRRIARALEGKDPEGDG